VRLFEETRALTAATPVTGTETYLVTSFGKAFCIQKFPAVVARSWTPLLSPPRDSDR
jgi:hypothetical protein